MPAPPRSVLKRRESASGAAPQSTRKRVKFEMFDSAARAVPSVGGGSGDLQTPLKASAGGTASGSTNFVFETPKMPAKSFPMRVATPGTEWRANVVFFSHHNNGYFS